MAKCDNCGKEIRFINRKGDKALKVNMYSVYFVPDLMGDTYFINGAVLRRGRVAQDGLVGYTLHNCEC